MFTPAILWSSSWASSSQFTLFFIIFFRYILILFSHLRLGFTSGFFLQVFPRQASVHFTSLSCMLNAPDCTLTQAAVGKVKTRRPSLLEISHCVWHMTSLGSWDQNCTLHIKLHSSECSALNSLWRCFECIHLVSNWNDETKPVAVFPVVLQHELWCWAAQSVQKYARPRAAEILAFLPA
jgi:uncharacterized MnhB-related membrane protein